MIFGNLKISYTIKFKDLSLREFAILSPLLILVLVAGIYPSYFLDFIHLSVLNLSINDLY